MPDSPALPFRLLRRGLRAASRAGSSAVDRVLRRDDEAPPFRPVPAAPRARPAPAGESVTVRFGGSPVRVPRGTRLLDAANLAGLDLRSYCGGNCSCGTCRVEIPDRSRRALAPASGMESMVLGAEAAGRGDRLACQAVALADLDVVIPEWF